MWSRWRNNSYTLEEQLSSLRQQVEAVESQLIEREAELVDLRIEMSAFQLKYAVRVGRKLEELEAVEVAIARCKGRIEQYRMWGPDGPPKERNGSDFVPIEEQYRRTWQQPPPPPKPILPAPLDARTEAELKKIYRQLCRRFHPDLTQDREERAWRTEMMTAINAAYEAQSLTELQALAARPDRHMASDKGTGQQRLEALCERLRQIERRIREVDQEILDLTQGSIVELSLHVKLASQQGQDLLSEMASDVERDLERKRVELDFLQAQLRQLGIEWE